jgi:hypothetical protein
MDPSTLAEWVKYLGPAGVVCAVLAFWLRLERIERLDDRKNLEVERKARDADFRSMYERQEKISADAVAAVKALRDALGAGKSGS